MNKSEVLLTLLNNGDKKEAKKMSKYMRGQFVFLGIPKPKRKELTKEFLKQSKKEPLDLDFVRDCFTKKYREFQYLAIEYLNKNKERLEAQHIELIEELILTQSWWDSADALDGITGYLVKKYPHLVNVMIRWSQTDNIWLNRVAIDHQLKFKEHTNTDVLEIIIKNNFGSDEVFINKAIGWALKQYSKTNPDYVKEFIEKYQENLSSLSLKEASQYI